MSPRTSLTLAILLLSSSAFAQSAGFALDRFDPAERGSEWMSTESLDLRGHPRPALGATLDWAHKPLVVYDANGEEVDAPVREQLFLHLGGAIVLWERLQLGVNLPVALAVAGDETTAGGVTYAASEGANVGDLRLGALARIAGEPGDAAVFAAGLQVHAPTGSREAFTGDGSARVVPRVVVAGDAGPLAYSARVGVNFRTQGDDFGGAPFGSELVLGAAAGVRLLDEKLLVGPELWTSTVVSDSGDGLFAELTTPVEVLFGGHGRIAKDWLLGAGVAPGLTRALGTPEVRVLASIDWAPAFREAAAPAAPADSDGDGILDPDDDCPEEPGVPEYEGCPVPDSDGDGVLDPDDKCPDEVGTAELEGCAPPPDRDEDGVLDPDDKCPDEAGTADLEGCPPPPDRDSDGILDADDKCPGDAGPKDEVNPEKHGCPKAVIVGEQIKILERVEFDTGKATLRPESDGVLDAVLEILKAHSEITKVRIEGHTDSRGNAYLNRGLSQKRAATVVAWLVERGIEPERLEAKGFGSERPIEDNQTELGRQNNRRVEFHIVEGPGAAGAGADE